MNYKKWAVLLAAAVFITGRPNTAMAAQDTVISLDESAVAFTKVEQDLDFREMEPGEERAAVIRLTNISDSSMDFYISGEIIYNIADASAAEKNAVYDLELAKDGEETPFFQGMIGSAENKKHSSSSLGLDYLQDDTLLSGLAEGESTTVTIRLRLDGDSTENEYMNKAGQIRIHIYTAQTAVDAPGNFVTDLITNVLTGDRSDFMIYIVGAAAAVFIISAVVVTGRKRREQSK